MGEPSRVNVKPHPTETPEYWESLAYNERCDARDARLSKWGTVDSIRIHEKNAAEYEERAKTLRSKS